jgi:hypothetical protein
MFVNKITIESGVDDEFKAGRNSEVGKTWPPEGDSSYSSG